MSAPDRRRIHASHNNTKIRATEMQLQSRVHGARTHKNINIWATHVIVIRWFYAVAELKKCTCNTIGGRQFGNIRC